MSEPERGCERFDESFESYVDGELDPAATAALEAHAADCVACSRELELARRVRSGLRALPSLEAPAPAVHAVLARVRDESDRHRGWRWLLPPRPAAIAVAAAMVLVMAVAVAWIQGRQPAARVALDDPSVVLDEAAVARATLETKLALAHFADASRKVGRQLGRDLLRERAVVPIGRSVSESLDGYTDGVERGGSPMPERG